MLSADLVHAPYGAIHTPTLQEIVALYSRDAYCYNLDFFRILNLDDMLARTTKIPGTVVECGTGTGMTLASMILICRALGIERRFWSFDSFEGLPAPAPEDLGSSRSLARKGDLYFGGMAVVLDKLHHIGVPDDAVGRDVHLVKGFFNETLPDYTGGPIALLHADADLYESTKTILDEFWPRLSVGGVVVFDEYDNTTEWPGEKLAADEYFSRLAPGAVRLERDRFSLRYNAFKLMA
jgi:hypothetical protein